MTKHFLLLALLGGSMVARAQQAAPVAPPEHPTVAGFTDAENQKYENLVLRKQLLDSKINQFQTQAKTIEDQLKAEYAALFSEAKDFTTKTTDEHKIVGQELNPQTFIIGPKAEPKSETKQVPAKK